MPTKCNTILLKMCLSTILNRNQSYSPLSLTSSISLLDFQIYILFINNILVNPSPIIMDPFISHIKSLAILNLFYLFDTGSCYVAQARTELSILLPQLPECQDYKNVQLTTPYIYLVYLFNKKTVFVYWCVSVQVFVISIPICPQTSSLSALICFSY